MFLRTFELSQEFSFDCKFVTTCKLLELEPLCCEKRQQKSRARHCTEVRFASFLSGGFTTMTVINTDNFVPVKTAAGIMLIRMRSARVKQFLLKIVKFVFCHSKNTTKLYLYGNHNSKITSWAQNYLCPSPSVKIQIIGGKVCLR